VVQLVLFLEAAQDRDRVLDRRLAHEHRLEPPLERRVLLDVLLVFIERGRADAVQFAARQAGFSRLEASIEPSPLPAPISVCISSMNRMIRPRRP
jgi:hypothetical protein